jgi:AGZA family xanthine/uracil permease-like MFS transporter
MLNNYFELEKRGSNVRTEIVAGITTFATMAYILVVQSSMMADAGMNPKGVMIATALMSGIFTLMSAFYAKVPFALAPGMGSNAIMAYSIVATGQATWQVGVGMFVVTGAILVLLTLFKVREDMVRVMPKNLKVGIGAAVGIFLARLAVVNGGYVQKDFSDLGDLSQPGVQLAFIGLAIALVLNYLRIEIKGKPYQIRGAYLISILLTTVIGIFMGVVKVPSSIVSFDLRAISEVAFQADIRGVFTLANIPILIFFLFSDFFSTMGTSLGLAGKAGMLDENGNFPEISRVFLTDAVGTSVGGMFGITNVQTYVESAAGIEAGGRTGLTAAAAGVMFLLSMFFSPLFLMIPSAATSPVLILIGASMLEVLKGVDFTPIEWTPLALMLLTTAFTGDFVLGVALGVIVHVLISLVQYVFTMDRSKIPTVGTFLMAAIMSIKFFV